MRHHFTAFAALLAFACPAVAQETRTVVDDLGRTVEVPSEPKRIASLDGKLVTNLLIELGAPPIGTQARTVNQEIMLDAGPTVTGTFMGDTDLAFFGTYPIDVEAVAAAKPDLIIFANWLADNDMSQFEAIAPTVYVDIDARVGQDLGAFLAELTNTQDRLAILDARYEAQIAQLKAIVDTENTTVSTFRAFDGTIRVLHPLMIVGQVLEDAGFRFPEIFATFERGVDDIPLSAEELQQLDADWIVLPYYYPREPGPQAAYDAMEQAFPGWCQAMTACREGRVIYVPGFEATTASYDYSMVLVNIFQSHMATLGG